MLGLSSVGVLAGPIIGGALTQHASWRWCQYFLSTYPCKANGLK